MRSSSRLLVACLLVATAFAQSAQKPATPPANPADDYSGMYTFLQEGEFVQLDIGNDNKVGGFVSSYGNLESDKGAFLDHFIKTGSLKEQELTFTTAPVHGTWYEFKGRIARGDAKNRADEGYYVLKGAVTEFTSNEPKELCGGHVDCVWKKVADKTYARIRDVTLKSFPQDMDAPRRAKD